MPQNERTIVNGVTVFGTVLSLSGLIIAYSQIMSVKQLNKQIKTEVNNFIAKSETLLSVSDLEKANQFVNYITDKINEKKYELAYLRMLDLEEILIGIRNKKNYGKYKTEKYGNHLFNIKTDLNNINQFFLNSKNSVDFGKISENLKDTSTTVINLKNKLKNISHG
ncbi:MAG: hypothetical protein LBP72_01440 [Dysgonamonadaceae bacterium]|nr:hypothetical protein [Dysgonamonadaceae bacterium]